MGSDETKNRFKYPLEGNRGGGFQGDPGDEDPERSPGGGVEGKLPGGTIAMVKETGL